jgi:pimeloyl-ACP methyl ester carboxylesterase
LAKVLGVAAAALAVAALANHAVARRSERRHPPCGSFIEVDGVRLHYVDRGEGTPVVLLHGNGAMIEDFEISGVLDAVARRHRVIAFDRPGFGYSSRPRSTVWTAAAQAELLHKALVRLDVRRPILVGHSWGTLVALSMALEHQAETGAVVLLSGYYAPSLRLDVPLLTGPAIPVLGDLMRYTISPLLGWLLAPKVFRKIFAPAPVTTRFAAGFPTGLALRPWQIRASAADTALMIPAAAATLHRHGELTIPVIIVAGSGDELVDTEAQSKRLHSNLRRSDMREVAGAGHMVHHTSPRDVVAAIEAAVSVSIPADAPREVQQRHLAG